MGVWGAGLYQDDGAADLREMFADIARFPIPVGDLVERVVAAAGMGDDAEADEETELHLALADQLHRFGLSHPPTMDRARALIASGADLRVKEAQGMAPSDLKRRARVLEELAARWATPHPKPKARRMMKGPEPFVLAPGDVWAFPTMRHTAMPVGWWKYDPKTIDAVFKPDGWGALAVFDRWHWRDFEARYLIAVVWLAPRASPPTLEDVLTAPLDGWRERDWLAPADEVRYLAFENEAAASVRVHAPRTTLKRMRASRLGTLPLAPELLRTKALAIRDCDMGHPEGRSSLERMATLREAHLEGEPLHEVTELHAPHRLRICDLLAE